MKIRTLHLSGPAERDRLREFVEAALASPLGEALGTVAGETLELVQTGEADVVLVACPSPGDELAAWEDRVGQSLRVQGTALTLLYANAEGWASASAAMKAAARRLSLHPVRLLWGAESDRQAVEGDLLGAVLQHVPAARDRLLAQLHEGSAALLAWPRTLPDGTFVERPERERLVLGVADDTTTTRLLVGGPGAGKSALLAAVGAEMLQAGRTVVAVKADALPVGVDSDRALGEALGLPLGLTTVVRGLRLGGAVVVLVDQLDAVSALLDVRTERLDALLEFLGGVAGLTGVHVVASTRPFERAYDVRLRSIEAEEVELGTLDVPATEQALRANGLAHLVPSAAQIETPWALDVVVQARPEAGASLKLQSVLGAYWDAVVDVDPEGVRRRVVERLAADIANEESFWISEAALGAGFDGGTHVTDALVRDGVLVRFAGRPGTVGFRHQTLYAYTLARSFAAGAQSIADHVIGARRDSLFVRPTLLAALEVLRETDRLRYEHQLGRLLGADLRLHLRLLLVQWLGRQTEPTDWERERIRETLATDEGGQMLVALASNAASMTWLADEPMIQDWMDRDPAEVEPLLVWLRGSASKHPSAVRRLVATHWQDAAYDGPVDEMLSAFPLLNEDDVDRLCASAGRKTPFRALHRIMERAGPEGAVRVLRATLNKRLAEVDAAAAAVRAAAPGRLRTWWNALQERASVRWTQASAGLRGQPVPSAESVRLSQINWSGLLSGPTGPTYEGLLEGLGSGWRSGEARGLATESPGAFLGAVWPWVQTVISRMPVRAGVPRVEYEDRYTLRARDQGARDRLIELVMAAAASLAERDLDAWRVFAREVEDSDDHTVHAVLAHGYGRLGAEGASAAADYIAGDPRRMTLGDFENGHRHTQSVIRSVFEHGDEADRLRVQEAIVGFQMYPPGVLESHPDMREDRLVWQAQHRLRLLRAIPPAKRSARVIGLIQKGECELPRAPDWDHRTIIAEAVGPEVEAPGLAEMDDDALLALFDSNDDTTGWDYPDAQRRGVGTGGVEQQSRAFRALAVAAPQRVTTLLPRLNAERHQTYAAEALAGLVESGVRAESLAQMVVALDARGFTREGFRGRVARTLATAAEGGGLPDAVLALLRRWVTTHTTPKGTDDGDQPSHGVPSNSVSFGGGGYLGAVPGGRGTMTEAILEGYLNQTPPQPGAALDWLESRLPPLGTPTDALPGEAETSAAVWAHAAMHAITTLNDEPMRATALFDRVFDAFPDVWRLPFPPRMVAIGMHAFAPDETVERWLDALARSPVPLDRHLSGELTLIAQVARRDARYRDRVRAMIARDDNVALRGLGMAAAEVWEMERARDEAAAVLEATIQRAPVAPMRSPGSTDRGRHLWDGVRQVLWGEDTFDALTPRGRRVLAALAARPDVAVRVAEEVVSHAERLVGPDGTAETRRLAVRLARAISDAVGAMGVEDPDRWDARRVLGDLTSVALTVHRSAEPDLRAAGLDLFESLLRVDVFAATSAQRSIDEGVHAGDASGAHGSGRRRRREV